MPANKSRAICMGAAISIFFAVATAQTVPALQPQVLPTLPAITPAPALKYRDPANPITIGEVSDLQAAKVQQEYASKFGYTTQKVDMPSDASKMPAPRPRLIVSVLATWDKANNKPHAEAIVNGRFTSLSGGETLAPGVKVEQVLSTMLVLSVAPPTPKNTKASSQALQAKRYSLRAGSQSEIEL